jgi:ferredoxin
MCLLASAALILRNFTSPEVFMMEDEATVIEGITYEDHEQNIKEAAENCPVGVIKYTE